MSAEPTIPDSGTGPYTVQIGPPGKTAPSTLINWVDDGIYYTHLQRVKDVSLYRRAELFDGSRQWLGKARGGYDNTAFYSQWVEAMWNNTDQNRLPIPVFNEGFGKRLNESARLAQPQYRPVCTPKGVDPGIKEKTAAKYLQDCLRYRLTAMGWEAEEDILAYHVPLYGGAWLCSRWEEDWRETSLVPLTSAVQCPDCGFTLSDAIVPLKDFGGVVGSDGMNTLTPAGPGKGKVMACPMCDAHPELAPYSPNLEEAATKRDALDRSLGERKPKCDWTLKIASPYDVFPWNLGYDMRPGQVSDFVYCHAEKLSWVWEHYPANAWKVAPENPATLMAFHPIGGAPDLFTSLLDTKTFRDMVRIKERVQYPQFLRVNAKGEPAMTPSEAVGYSLSMGRHVVVANKEVLLDEYLMIPSLNSPGTYVPRVFMDYAPWEFLDGARRIQGFSQWQLMFNPQEIINEIVSQTQAVRRTTALPQYLYTRAMNLELESMEIGRPAQFFAFDVDPDAPAQKPELFNNSTIAGGVQTEMRVAEGFLDKMFPALETGVTQPNVDAAAAMRQLLEQSGTTREPRARRIKQAFVRVCKHGAALMQNLYGPDEERECKYTDDEGREQWDFFTATDLACDVEIDAEPTRPNIEEQRQGVVASIQNQVIMPQASPTLQRSIVGILAGDDVQKKLFEDEVLQEDAAKREWQAFRDKNRCPVVDPTLDDNKIHYQEHGRDCHSEWFRSLEDSAGWDDALQILGDTWLKDLEMVANPPPVPQMGPNGQPIMDPMTGQPVMGPAPQPPVSLQVRIQMFWTTKLGTSQIWPPKGKQIDPAALSSVMEFRAHMEAHRLYEQQKQAAAMSGAPTLASPGAAATPAGTQPTPFSPPAGQPGGPGVGGEGVQAQQAQQLMARSMAGAGKR